MRHVVSQISEVLDDTRRHDILDKIRACRRGELPLSMPVALLAHHASGEALKWRPYLAPFPAEFRLRNHT